jgi:exopolysaccharide biosynthesis predicted pyruvyltransferase EpsI
MSDADDFETAVATLAREAVEAFDWLSQPVPADSRVSFYPNPGNVGDAAINLACWRYLSGRFRQVDICAPNSAPSQRDVFVGGGGNLVEGYYEDIASFLKRTVPGQNIYLFPSTAVGYDDLLLQFSSVIRFVCREPVSYSHVSRLLPSERVKVGHDCSFALGPALRTRFANRIGQYPKRTGQFFRADRERAGPSTGGIDVFGHMIGFWTEMAQAERVLDAAIGLLLGCGEVHTDRLHGGILAGILGRRTFLYPNSYFKNDAVFHHSLVRLANVTLAERVI